MKSIDFSKALPQDTDSATPVWRSDAVIISYPQVQKSRQANNALCISDH
jgi:hypothetical protein